LAVRFSEGYRAGTPWLKAALSAFQREDVLAPEEARWLWLVSWAALYVWDDASWTVLSARQLDHVRRAGELSALPFALDNRSGVYGFMGYLATAKSLDEEGKAVTDATGIAAFRYGALSLAALRGREAEFSELIRTAVDEAKARGEGQALTIGEFVSGGLYNGLGRYDSALAATLPAEQFYAEAAAIWALTELIEAAVRCGQPERASCAFERVQESTRAAGTDWALGIEARLRALLSDADDAESLYREAITRLGRSSMRVHLARAYLLYGEWLRRERRPSEAREQLRTAHEFFRNFGMEGFAERARLELVATGERARKRTADTREQLTPQEAQVARLAAEGESNREIAVRLFISESTVVYHLHKVFRKLDVKSRAQLAHRLS
jgi:DNA-binding CsgD family transcriptional regulator